MIHCRDVHKEYALAGRSVQALRGVTLDIPDKGYHAIMGQSGSGKSTLLHLLSALDRPTSGEIEVAGKRVDLMSEREATQYRQHTVSLVFQQFNLISTLTAQENVELPGLLAGEPVSKLRTRSAELLERLGIGDRGNHRPEALSGGEQQRVAIARALFFHPPVLLADEPTGNLDSASSERLWALLGDIAREHDMTVLLVTHEPVAAAHCQTVHVMRDGQICGTINSETLDAAGVASRYQQLIVAA
ncbi:MAG: ABC transporter ATP-binding protein [Phycisphaeraceae bacterium]|nr:ABC transporter ATP-binding protein [Phycisphaerales bacterium]MCB9861348.1 ABC transporter ATP-binding protein [Phycisphaeraceae bacterium]